MIMSYDCTEHARLICGAFLLLTTGGCATTSDPSKGGFVSGVTSLSRGAYEERLEQKKQVLQQEQSRLDQLQSEAARSEQDKLDADQELSIIENCSKALRRQIVDLRRKVEKARHAQSKDVEEYRQLFSEVQALEEEISLVSTNPTLSRHEKLEEIDALTRKRAALEEVLGTLLE
jgi:chromosome segregation ATPase